MRLPLLFQQAERAFHGGEPLDRCLPDFSANVRSSNSKVVSKTEQIDVGGNGKDVFSHDGVHILREQRF